MTNVAAQRKYSSNYAFIRTFCLQVKNIDLYVISERMSMQQKFLKKNTLYIKADISGPKIEWARIFAIFNA